MPQIMVRISVFFCLLCSIVTQSQTFNYNADIALFQDGKSKQPVVIIQDSVLYSGTPLTKKTFKHTPYLGKLNHYIPFHIAGRTYLSHDGCGSVLEYRNDSIVRIDHSFLHLNQIGASTFNYKNTIYYFGGYGLFTFKNIVTKYNFQTNEWDKVNTYGDEIPSPRSDAYSQLIGDKLFVFSGHEENETVEEQKANTLPFVWELDLVSKQWKKLGSYDDKLNFNRNSKLFTANGKLYSLISDGNSYLFEIDFASNRVKKYTTMAFISLDKLYYDSKTDEIVCINNQETTKKSTLLRIKMKDLKGELLIDEKFITSSIPNYVYLIASLLLLVCVGLFYRNTIRNLFTPFKGMIYKKSTEEFYYNGKQIVFDTNETLLLKLLFEKIPNYVTLIELNKVFEVGEESFTAITKRRELAYNLLASKLTTLLDLPENKLILQRKNSSDKRIKEIKLSSFYFKVND